MRMTHSSSGSTWYSILSSIHKLINPLRDHDIKVIFPTCLFRLLDAALNKWVWAFLLAETGIKQSSGSLKHPPTKSPTSASHKSSSPAWPLNHTGQPKWKEEAKIQHLMEGSPGRSWHPPSSWESLLHGAAPQEELPAVGCASLVRLPGGRCSLTRRSPWGRQPTLPTARWPVWAVCRGTAIPACAWRASWKDRVPHLPASLQYWAVHSIQQMLKSTNPGFYFKKWKGKP